MAGGVDDTSDDGTWRYTWPAGERLLSELTELIDPRGKTVIDLGCGRGRLGRWALEHGATRVVFADQSSAALAEVMGGLGTFVTYAQALQHSWGEPLPRVDLVLGGDILYRAQMFGKLLTSVASALAQGGRAVLADPRVNLEPELPVIAAECGLSWSTERRPTSYTLCTLARQ